MTEAQELLGHRALVHTLLQYFQALHPAELKDAVRHLKSHTAKYPGEGSSAEIQRYMMAVLDQHMRDLPR